ncbi:MAG: hypothetical protein KA744_10925 [Phenylobacterium sp.]|nr:hypothetical protein [Phenylobacterium sp.]
MLILVSGEGPTDMGQCCGESPTGDAAFTPGPMAWLVDQIAEASEGYSFLALELMCCVSEQTLSRRSKELRPPSLPGRKRGKETAYYFRNARALAVTAGELAATSSQSVVAVLFRDSDGTQSAGRGDWQAKWDSMIKGFDYEHFATGVPMIPKPKSEAWLLCALKTAQPYQHCEALEFESGNDNAPRSLKAQLTEALNERPNAAGLAELVRSGTVDASQIEMPSFSAFKVRLEGCLRPLQNDVSL